MTGTAATGGSPRPASDLPTARNRSEVNTMKTTLLHLLQTAASVVAPRPKSAVLALAPVCAGAPVHGYETAIGNGITGTWLATSRLSMTVPAFHDRRPLCSTT